MAGRDSAVTAEASEWDPPSADSSKLFDVTCVIGSVHLGQGDDNPTQAAFRLIADHDAEGHYSFPTEDGGRIHVTVEHEQSKRDAQ